MVICICIVKLLLKTINFCKFYDLSYFIFGKIWNFKFYQIFYISDPNLSVAEYENKNVIPEANRDVTPSNTDFEIEEDVFAKPMILDEELNEGLDLIDEIDIYDTFEDKLNDDE